MPRAWVACPKTSIIASQKNAPLRPPPLFNKSEAQMELPIVKIRDKFSHTYIIKKRMLNFVLFFRERKHIPPSSRYVV